MVVKHHGRLYTVMLCWHIDRWWQWDPTATSWSPPLAKGFVQVCDNLLNKQVESSLHYYWNGWCQTPLQLMVKAESGECLDLTEVSWLVEDAAKQIKARLTRLLKKGRRERKVLVKSRR